MDTEEAVRWTIRLRGYWNARKKHNSAQFDAACVVMQADPVALAEDRAEMMLWDSTLADDLDDAAHAARDQG